MFYYFFKDVVHSLEPGETPSYSASHQAQNYVQRSLISQSTVKKRQKYNLQEPQRNRNETGFFVNLVRTSTVRRQIFKYDTVIP